jgi:hypothetical protein
MEGVAWGAIPYAGSAVHKDMDMGNCKCLRRKAAAVCGRYCCLCDCFRNGDCCGCGYQLGQTSGGECAVFRCCVVERGLEHCGLCIDFPCQVFVSQSAPLDVARLYKALQRRAEIGTEAWLDEQEEQHR